MPKIDADTVTRAGFDAISIERLRAYVAVMFIVEFSPPEAAAASLASLERLHEQAPRLADIRVCARRQRAQRRARHETGRERLLADPLRDRRRTVQRPAAADRTAASAAGRAAATAAHDRWRQPEIAGYTLMKKIAQSAAASVYLARNDEFAQPVALKIQAIKGQQVRVGGRSRAIRQGMRNSVQAESPLDSQCAGFRRHR